MRVEQKHPPEEAILYLRTETRGCCEELMAYGQTYFPPFFFTEATICRVDKHFIFVGNTKKRRDYQ